MWYNCGSMSHSDGKPMSETSRMNWEDICRPKLDRSEPPVVIEDEK